MRGVTHRIVPSCIYIIPELISLGQIPDIIAQTPLCDRKWARYLLKVIIHGRFLKLPEVIKLIYFKNILFVGFKYLVTELRIPYIPNATLLRDII